MGYRLQTEAVLESGREVKYVNAPFDIASKLITEAKGKHITAEELANARRQFPKYHSLNDNGSYTRAGFVYKKGNNPIRASLSPLVQHVELAKLAVEANGQDRYFTTQDAKVYDELREMADEDKKRKIIPAERRAMLLPSRGRFYVSPDENPDFFEIIFGENGREYLKFTGFPKIAVDPVSQNVVDNQEGTLLTQEWLRRLGDESDVGGDDWDLNYGDRVRGVFEKTGEAGRAEKTMLQGTKLPYTLKEVARIQNKVSKLEAELGKVSAFLAKLRK